ncbi:hypothetical protein LCGC14_0599750 [marine sediment metagenome]|uniref:Uncharacterized protein n=1 Tax=marine sediment metagenome TaxID=412755 RepID=A0A0F9RB43_9ZZZZ
MKRIKEMWFNYYYAAEGGPFSTCSTRNMIILTALVFAAHC